MKRRLKNLFSFLALIAGLGLILADRVTAQTFTKLHTFTALDIFRDYTNSDGANPVAGLILSGNTLYGTARVGGSSGNGTVFKVNTNGTGFTTLHSFTAGDPNTSTNSDGADPEAGLILSGNTLYGTAFGGGSSLWGTVFAVNTNGTGFTNLHSFTGGSGGGVPIADLILSGNTLYGTAEVGGWGSGTVFKVNTNGTGFTTLYTFTALPNIPPLTNSDGAYPSAGLILSGNILYGTAHLGGSAGNGTLFRINADGTSFTTLHSFAATPGSPPYINGDGASPSGNLILSGSTLYGTTGVGGSSGTGTMFAVNTNGTGFTTLHSFTTLSIGPPYPLTNSDGAFPSGNLVLATNTLYGTAGGGGSSGNGTVFKVNTNGTGFTTLHSFTATSGGSYPFPSTNSDGAGPSAGLILSGNTLYGTAFEGGSSGYGTVFSLSLPAPPQLTIIASGTNVILTWPTNAAGFTLQSTTNLGSPAVWTTVSPGPVVVNGQNAVTNPISGTQKFYRLSQ